MNLPTKITISRIALTFVFMFFLFSKGVAAKALALFTFLLAAFTDFLDGYIAKKTNCITDFGRLLDPIADKILVLAAFMAFVEMEIIPAWMVVIIIFREVTITGLRIMALSRGKVIAADDGGKHKTVSQILAIFVILVYIILREAGINIVGEGFIFFIMLITVSLTMISGVSYLVKNKEIYTNAKKS